MAGCSKSEVVDTPNGDGNTPIKLKTFVGKSVKATETKTDNLTAFQMTAYTTSAAFPGTASTDEPTPFIASQLVSRTGESSLTAGLIPARSTGRRAKRSPSSLTRLPPM